MPLPILASSLALVLFLLCSVPIHASIGLSVVIAVTLGNIPSEFMVQKLFMALDNFPLLAVPFFILAGEIMQKGTMAESLLRFSRSLVGHIAGGMSQISVLTCMFYGALSGSAPATVAAVGGIMIPTMAKDKYPLPYATAVNATAGCLGVLIPPSVPLIIYGTQVKEVSVGDLFIAGILPGLFVGLALMVMCYITARRKAYGTRSQRSSLQDVLAALSEAKGALGVPVIVLGGIYGGIVTPTEAGAIAVAYVFLIEGAVNRSLDMRKVLAILKSTAMSTASIFIVVAPAIALGQILLLYNMPDAVARLLSFAAHDKYLLLAAIIGILLITGTFLDTISNIVLLTPLFLPTVIQAGINPTHFGIIMIFALAIGFLTPPVGVNLFVACGISKLRIEELSYALLPFLVVLVILLFLVAYIPWLSLALVPGR